MSSVSSLSAEYTDYMLHYFNKVTFSSGNAKVFSLLFHCNDGELHILPTIPPLTSPDKFWPIHQSGRGHGHHNLDTLNWCQNWDSAKETQMRPVWPWSSALMILLTHGVYWPKQLCSHSLQSATAWGILHSFSFWEMDGEFCKWREGNKRL